MLSYLRYIMKNIIEILDVYGFLGIIRLFRDKLFTILYFNNARIIRCPVYIRGKKKIVGCKNLTTGVNLRIDIIGKGVLKIGDNVQLNDYVHIGVVNSVIIEDNVLIASKVFITDHNHGKYKGEVQSNPLENPINRTLDNKAVLIKKNAWIGEYVSVMPGVTIGEGSVVGAMSVVTKDIPDYAIAVGSPAKVIKSFNFNTNNWK
ncbi:Putative acetyltransferase [Flavobacterium columnare]|uniref:Acetyltransferase n=2 Tax=Flavobacterium TaxID=237 RepID=A0A2N9P933_9FLAO|nr:Putative acetyltransferase [Flavobacterium columnare]